MGPCCFHNRFVSSFQMVKLMMPHGGDNILVVIILVVVSNMFYVHPENWGKISNLTNIFQMG